MDILPGLSPSQLHRLLLSSMTGPIEHYQRPIFVTGWPGLGKTAITRQVAAAAQISYRNVRLLQHDPVELTGLPSVERGEDGRTRAHWVPFEELLPSNPDWTGMLVFDEVTQLSADAMKVVASIIDRDGVAGSRIPRNARFVLLGNSTQHRAGANRLLSHLQSRCKQVELQFSLPDWQTWANSLVPKPLHPIVRSFSDFRGSSFVSFDPALDINPVPRQWEGVSDELYLHDGADDSFDPILETVFGSLVGPGMGAEFSAFRKHWNLLHGVVDQVLSNPAGPAIPTDPSVIHALVGSVAHRVAELNGKVTDQQLTNLIVFGNRLSDSFSALLVRNTMVASKAADRIVKIPAGMAWVNKHRQALMAGQK